MKAQPTAAKTDRDLIATVLQLGDEQAFRELYRRHTPRLLGFVSRLLAGGNPEEEDVAQETWIRACEQLRGFQWRSTFSTWLLGIGLNVVRESLRKEGRSRTVSTALFSNPQRPGADCEACIDLERAIRTLPDEYRLVLVLHDVEGMKHHEIAEQLKIPVGTSKSQLFRARRMIRGWLSERKEVKP